MITAGKLPVIIDVHTDDQAFLSLQVTTANFETNLVSASTRWIGPKQLAFDSN